MNYQPNDLNSVKILICYLLYHIEENIDSEALYEIAVDSGIINYFYYNDAVDELIINDTIYSEADENGKIFFSLSEKGVKFVKDFSSYVQRSFRDRLMYEAMKYKANTSKRACISVNYEDTQDGCSLICSVRDNSKQLVNFTLYTDSRFQAQLIGEKLTMEASDFYKQFIDFLLDSK
ncbi:MAG: DUF4364 family protein [Oscillospiraceae bacterium]|nr:DUF4364 family protein [Oscillospiraceae bacterium]